MQGFPLRPGYVTLSLLVQRAEAYPVSIHAVIPGMVATDFYKDVKTSPKLAADARSVPYALEAFGVPLDVVGRSFVRLAAQEPGKVTGKTYALLGGRRLMRGIGLMLWYRMTGKVGAT